MRFLYLPQAMMVVLCMKAWVQSTNEMRLPCRTPPTAERERQADGRRRHEAHLTIIA